MKPLYEGDGLSIRGEGSKLSVFHSWDLDGMVEMDGSSFFIAQVDNISNAISQGKYDDIILRIDVDEDRNYIDLISKNNNLNDVY